VGLVQPLTVLLLFGLGIALPHGVIVWDERRLSAEQLARAWSPASHWAAVVVFSGLCLPVHFWRTRRSFRGVLLGLGWMLACALVQGSVAAFGTP
jgi:hypothetical protein